MYNTSIWKKNCLKIKINCYNTGELSQTTWLTVCAFPRGESNPPQRCRTRHNTSVYWPGQQYGRPKQANKTRCSEEKGKVITVQLAWNYKNGPSCLSRFGLHLHGSCFPRSVFFAALGCRHYTSTEHFSLAHAACLTPQPALLCTGGRCFYQASVRCVNLPR